ncbi:MAG: hypothetical protein CYPHOPRED_002336 [Cyphobasidiales sp. Tagirdzhanova-0007]|nr:MAG: hypothetical protein CYPHOPRED_002336 [Cyphobasidiales sp. Tagirdzhanova-0007]
MPDSLATIDASADLDSILDAIARDGGVIVSNFLSPELLAETMQAIEPHFKPRTMYTSKATHKELGEDFFPEGSLRVYALLARIPNQIIQIMRLPIWQVGSDEFASWTGEKLISQKSGYMLATTAGLRLVPGAKSQPLHRDQIAYQTRPDPNNKLFTPLVGCLIAGSKCTKANGATAVIPGSHLWNTDRAPKVEECAFAEMEPGSALFTLGSTYHGAGENVCDPTDPDAIRTLFAVFGRAVFPTFAKQRDYFRRDQEEVMSTPIEVARELPDDILRLAGYYKAIGGVGYVEDHQNPVEFLKSKTSMGKLGASETALAV